MSSIVTMGEIMLRLSPLGFNKISDSNSFDASYGGSEGNVAIALANFKKNVKYITALPDNELGKGALYTLKKHGVNTDFIKVGGDNLGIYFVQKGFGTIPSSVIYNRKHSEVSKLSLDNTDFDYDSIFSDAELFHISGISFALSNSFRELCFKFLDEAKKRNIQISFDMNYRNKLWSISQAKEIYQNILPYVDILFCSSKDLEVFFESDSNDTAKKYNIDYLVKRDRKISDNKHSATISILHKGIEESYTTKEFEVLDRVGGGDAFSAGVIYSLSVDKNNLEKAIEFGANCFVLKHFISGDFLTLNKEQIDSYCSCSNNDIKR